MNVLAIDIGGTSVNLLATVIDLVKRLIAALQEDTFLKD